MVCRASLGHTSGGSDDKDKTIMPKRALFKTKLPVISYGEVSCSVGTIGRQSRADTILSTFQSLLELSMVLTSGTSPRH